MTAVELRLPELSGGTTQEQLRRMQSYLYTLAQQLQIAFDTVTQQSDSSKQQADSPSSGQENPAVDFAAVKALPLKILVIIGNKLLGASFHKKQTVQLFRHFLYVDGICKLKRRAGYCSRIGGVMLHTAYLRWVQLYQQRFAAVPVGSQLHRVKRRGGGCSFISGGVLLRFS